MRGIAFIYFNFSFLRPTTDRLQLSGLPHRFLVEHESASAITRVRTPSAIILAMIMAATSHYRSL
jgi:hypothetical protein